MPYVFSLSDCVLYAANEDPNNAQVVQARPIEYEAVDTDMVLADEAFEHEIVDVHFRHVRT